MESRQHLPVSGLTTQQHLWQATPADSPPCPSSRSSAWDRHLGNSYSKLDRSAAPASCTCTPYAGVYPLKQQLHTRQAGIIISHFHSVKLTFIAFDAAPAHPTPLSSSRTSDWQVSLSPTFTCSNQHFRCTFTAAPANPASWSSCRMYVG